MGVASSGKSSTGAALARTLGAPFLDADEFHPAGNVAKMRAGIPLSDEERWPWLAAYSAALRNAAGENSRVVGACSALRRRYRDFLRETVGEEVMFIHLHGSRELIASRISRRSHQYMSPGLLDSQFATLEPPVDGENAVQVDIAEAQDEVVARIVNLLAGVRGTRTHSR